EGLRREPPSFYGWLARGQIARAAGQVDAAAQAYREALAINPSLAVAHLELGRLAEARGDRNGARTEYQLAVDGDATSREARHPPRRPQPPDRHARYDARGSDSRVRVRRRRDAEPRSPRARGRTVRAGGRAGAADAAGALVDLHRQVPAGARRPRQWRLLPRR